MNWALSVFRKKLVARKHEFQELVFPSPSFLLQIQMLHNKHVMVRVGGGWETFAGYLLKHDPCRMLQISRVDGKTSPIQNKSPTIKDMNPDSYLVVSAHYKTKKEIK